MSYQAGMEGLDLLAILVAHFAVGALAIAGNGLAAALAVGLGGLDQDAVGIHGLVISGLALKEATGDQAAVTLLAPAVLVALVELLALGTLVRFGCRANGTLLEDLGVLAVLHALVDLLVLDSDVADHSALAVVAPAFAALMDRRAGVTLLMVLVAVLGARGGGRKTEAQGCTANQQSSHG